MRNKRKGYQTKNLPKKEGVQAAVNDRKWNVNKSPQKEPTVAVNDSNLSPGAKQNFAKGEMRNDK